MRVWKDHNDQNSKTISSHAHLYLIQLTSTWPPEVIGVQVELDIYAMHGRAAQAMF